MIRQWTLATANSGPLGITSGGDGNIYFTERNSNKVGMISVADGTYRLFEWFAATPNSLPNKITKGADGNVWWTERGANNIGTLVH
jgi:virginiamycin B lyase